VKVVGHQIIGVAQPVEAFDGVAEDIEKQPAVAVVVIDDVTPVAPRGNMVKRAGKFDPERSGHART
jgi:hypothetical protein